MKMRVALTHRHEVLFNRLLELCPLEADDEVTLEQAAQMVAEKVSPLRLARRIKTLEKRAAAKKE